MGIGLTDECAGRVRRGRAFYSEPPFLERALLWVLGRAVSHVDRTLALWSEGGLDRGDGAAEEARQEESRGSVLRGGGFSGVPSSGGLEAVRTSGPRRAGWQECAGARSKQRRT